MPQPAKIARFSVDRLWAGLLDVLVIILAGIWIHGGISWNGVTYLKYGADLRRTTLLLLVASYLFVPETRDTSICLRFFIKSGTLLTQSRFRWAFYGLVALIACTLSVLQLQALRVTLYDVGIFHQILWSVTHGLGFHSTISSGNGDFLSDHLSPSLVLLAPFFSLSGSSPYFLPVAHTLLIFLGGAAWIFWAFRIPGLDARLRGHFAAAATVFTVSFESLWGNLRWGFHENALGFVSISWALTLLFTKNYESSRLRNTLRDIAVCILFLIAAGSKEILMLDIALALGCWAVFEFHREPTLKGLREKWIFFAFLTILTSCLVAGFVAFETMAHPTDKNYFGRYYSYLGEDLGSFVRGLLLSPLQVFRVIGMSEILKYFWTVFSPWLFLPLVLLIPQVRRRSYRIPFIPIQGIWILAFFPSLMSALLSVFPPLRQPNYHYVLELWPVLAILTLFVLARKQSTSLVWAWALFGIFRMDTDPIRDFRTYREGAQQVKEIRMQLKNLPASATISADDLAGPWVSSRQWVTRWSDLRLLPNQCPDLILVRFAEKGTLTERGVRALLSRCVGYVPNDLVTSWRIGEWAAIPIGYEVLPLSRAVPRRHFSRHRRHGHHERRQL